jgi:hypothetical protein
MRISTTAVLTVALAVSACSRLPTVKQSRLTPKPMTVAFAGFASNRFYQNEKEETLLLVPVLNVDAQYAAFRGRLAEHTAGRFAIVPDEQVKSNAAYRRRANARGISATMEAAKTASASGMIMPRPTDVDLARELCRELGVDGVLWVMSTLAQVERVAFKEVGEYSVRARTEIWLVGKSGKVWRDVVTMTSSASFAAVKGVALPAQINGAANEVAGRVPVRMAERLKAKAP